MFHYSKVFFFCIISVIFIQPLVLLSAETVAPEAVDLYITFDRSDKAPDIIRQGWALDDDGKGMFAGGISGKGLVMSPDGTAAMRGRVGRSFYDEGALSFWFKPVSFIIGDRETFYTCTFLSAGSRASAQKQVFLRNTNRGTFLHVWFLQERNPVQTIVVPVSHWENGNWYNIVLNWKNGGYTLHVNGEKLGETEIEDTFLEQLKNSMYVSLFSYITPGVEAEGVIDDFAVFGSALALQQLAETVKVPLISAEKIIEERSSMYRIVIPDHCCPTVEL